jgi:hypothetical protein
MTGARMRAADHIDEEVRLVFCAEAFGSAVRGGNPCERAAQARQSNTVDSWASNTLYQLLPGYLPRAARTPNAGKL